MSSYIVRWCPSHGEWDQDIDDPYEECPECTEKGIAPSQLEKQTKDALKQEIESLRRWMLDARDDRDRALQERDEWKRRLERIIDWMNVDTIFTRKEVNIFELLLQEIPEVKDWF